MLWYDELTEKQRIFCEVYASNGGNGTAAAIVAGYKKPDVESSRMLRNAKIYNALEALRQSRTNDAIATREERQAFWTTVMRDGEVEYKDRLKASELLGKCQADFIERVDATTRIIVEHAHESIDG